MAAYKSFGYGGFPGASTPGGRLLVEEIAASRGATARQVALRVLVRRLSLFMIPKASTPEHAADIACAGVLRLAEADLTWIDLAVSVRPPAAAASHAVGP